MRRAWSEGSSANELLTSVRSTQGCGHAHPLSVAISEAVLVGTECLTRKPGALDHNVNQWLNERYFRLRCNQ